MTYYRVLIDGNVIANRVSVAQTFLKRIVGLLKHKKLSDGEGLLIRPCSQIHTYFMRFDIDVLFLSGTGEIVHIEEKMEPGLASRFVRNSNQVLELKSGTVREKGVTLGKKIAFDIAD